jgi:putative aldouronate transport system permease protein
MHKSTGEKAFNILNVMILSLVTLASVMPMIYLLAISLSSSEAVNAGKVSFIPIGFTLQAYTFLMQKSQFLTSFLVSIERVALGTVINMLLAILTAYPLSKETAKFKARTTYVWFFAVTMFFGGGLVPSYVVVQQTGIMDTIWALVLPGALNVWNMVMLLNFFRGIPKELEEAAFVDGAKHGTVLWSIFVPVSKPALATILIFTIVGHWNAWFDGIIYMNSMNHYPLQSYLSTLVTQDFSRITVMTPEELKRLEDLSNKTLKIAQIFLGALPIMMVYPFLQKYFIKGITLGSVKG